jgi:hypothetical protein
MNKLSLLSLFRLGFPRNDCQEKIASMRKRLEEDAMEIRLIKTARDYRAALSEIEGLMQAESGTAEGTSWTCW